MFSINGHRLPMVSSYAEAEQAYERGPELRNGSWNERGLVNKREYDKRVVKVGDEYRFTFHRTPLVTWVNEHTVRITPWSSLSSRVFANRFTPASVAVTSGRRGETLVIGHKDAYVMNQETTLVRNGNQWVVDSKDTVESFCEYKVIDHKKARAVRQAVADYKKWFELAGRKDRDLRNPKGIVMVLELEPAFFSDDPVESWVRLANDIGCPDKLAPAALVAQGLVKAVPAPAGVVPSPSVYEPFI